MIGEVAGRVDVASIDVVLGDEFAPGVALVAKWIKKNHIIISMAVLHVWMPSISKKHVWR